MSNAEIATRTGTDLIVAVPAGPRAEESYLAARARLGIVRPRDPRTRRLGPPVHRMDLLADLCDDETTTAVMHWLTNSRLRSDQTARDYADDIRHWTRVVAEELGLVPFSFRDITPDLIRIWRLAEESRRRADGARVISDRTILRRLSAITSLYDYTRWRTGEQNLRSPVTKYDRPQIDPNDESTATPILEKHELNAIFDAAKTPREAFVPMVIYTFAGRVTECCAIRLEHHAQYRDGRRHLDVLRKRSKGRMWAVPDGLEPMANLVLGDRTTGGLFLDDNDRELDRHGVDDLLTRLGRRAQVLPARDHTAHMYRASRLTHMYDEGIPLEVIQEFADHEKIETTRRYIRRRMASKARLAHAEQAAAVFAPAISRWITTN
ncbi:tyrosine-type recombinase/integrase [Streptomyces sp. NPDC051079]|uniref:tyrosine-type recombinase/integrase n=1 Tax=Streptomyces sp. NPDC051079 TaxID=3155043 RepID=UPI00344C01CC